MSSTGPRGQFDPRRYTPLFLLVVLAVFAYVGRILLLSPSGFLGFLGTLALLVMAAVLVARLIHHLFGIKCPTCGLAMYHVDDRGAFNGTVGADEAWFAPIAIRVLQCRKCGKEYHRVYQPKEVGPEHATRHNTFDAKFMSELLGAGDSKMLKDMDFSDRLGSGKMTPGDYQQLQRQIARAVDEHNRRQGFIVK